MLAASANWAATGCRVEAAVRELASLEEEEDASHGS